MRETFGYVVVGLIVLVAAPAVWACTASSAVDTAKHSRDKDEYRMARDVAEDFLDSEGFEKTPDHLDVATGTLLLDPSVFNPGWPKDVTEFRARLDKETWGHGYRDGQKLSEAYSASNTTSEITVRDHVRLHTWEVDEALKGNFEPDPVLRYTFRDKVPTASPAPAAAPAPAATPTPVATPAPLPAPAIAPRQSVPPALPPPPPVFVDHAG